jgi:RsiW-degrading membrane proteinase PrsW (M82 family)
MAYAALFMATAVPLLFLYLIHTLDLYGTGSTRAIAFSFAWGAASVFMALAIYRLAHDQLGLLSEQALVRYMAPVVEETIKALALLYLIRRPTFTYFIDGAVYGFATGVGFAVFENYLYIFQNLDIGLGTALGRVLSTNLMHASAGAMVGIALGVSRFRRFRGRALFLSGGLSLAILLHAVFNHLVARSAERQLFLFAVGVGLCGVAFTALVIRRGLATEKVWIAETLGLANRITPAESTAARRLEHADSLLDPLRTLFGDRKASQIEELLLLQAQLGILRKTRERSHQRPRTQQAISREIELKQERMEEVRRGIGAYTMASLRALFPVEGNPMWQRLAQQLATPDRTAQPAAENLFALLEARRQKQGQQPETTE